MMMVARTRKSGKNGVAKESSRQKRRRRFPKKFASPERPEARKSQSLSSLALALSVCSSSNHTNPVLIKLIFLQTLILR
jgi:hypothetical protein